MFLFLDINVVLDILVHGLNRLTFVNKNWPTTNIVSCMMKIDLPHFDSSRADR